MIINPCPSANKNSIIIEFTIFAESVANAIIPAKIGVEQGVPIKANTAPKKIGYKIRLFVLFCGISLIKTGNSKSRKPTSFKPIIIKTDATISAKNGDVTKTLPVIAQIMPIPEKTIAVPSTKNNICISVVEVFSFEYPPTYPIIKGNIEREQGETDAIKPPTKETMNNSIIFAS